MTESDKKYFHQTTRCPNCHEKGQMTTVYGSIVCPKCDQSFRYPDVLYFNKAFEAGREFERNNTNYIREKFDNDFVNAISDQIKQEETKDINELKGR